MAASKMVVVAGPSMEPTMHTGDVVFVWPQSRYEVGDTLVYRVPEGSPGAGVLVVHRLVGFQGEEMVLQGDNNEEVDPWNPNVDHVVGKQRLLVPKVGLLASILRQPAVLAALVAGMVSAAAVNREEDSNELSGVGL
jgi:signal peptidase